MTIELFNGSNDPKPSRSTLQALADSLARSADEAAERAKNFVFLPDPDLAKEFRTIGAKARSASASLLGPVSDETSAGDKPASPEEVQQLTERLLSLMEELIVNAKNEDSEAREYYYTTDLAIEEINDEGNDLLEAARACFPALASLGLLFDPPTELD